MGNAAKSVASVATLGLYNPKSERTSTSTTQGEIDKALLPLRGEILDQSLAFAKKPITQYGGERVAGFSPLQEQAFGQLGALGQQGQGLAQRGFNILGGLGTADQRLSAYYNPYEQQVLDRSMNDLERQRQIAMQQTAGQSLANKAFGGSRQAVRDALTNEAFAKQAADTAANLRYQGYNTALNAAQQELAQQQSLAQALGQMGYGAIGAMGGAGEAQQALAQQQLDAAKEAYYEPEQQQMQRLNFLSGIASGVPQAGTQTNIGIAAPNTAQGFFGNLGALSGAIKNFGSLGGTPS